MMIGMVRQTLRRATSMSQDPVATPILQSIAGMSDCENVATRLWHRGFADEPASGQLLIAPEMF